MSAFMPRNRNDESPTSSDSDDYHKLFFSSSSHERSSVGSIPWAEDAIKQNQIEWEKIERMFYGEEDLPDHDQELRREIVEWTTAFPHIRIVGRKLKPNDRQLQSSDSNAGKSNSDDSVESTLPGIDQRWNKSFIIHPEAKSIYLNMDLSRLLERDMRISSVPMVSKRRQLIDLNGTQRADDVWLKPAPKPTLQATTSRKYIRRQIYPTDSIVPSFLNMNDPTNNHKVSNVTSKSARLIRMPPIVNFILPPQTKYLPTGSAKSHLFLSTANTTGATKSTRIHQPIALPMLKINQREIRDEDFGGRSISAAVNERRMRAMYLTNSASKLKISK